MGQKVIVRNRYIYKDIFWEGPQNYEIIDNRMNEDMTNKIVDICRSASIIKVMQGLEVNI